MGLLVSLAATFGGVEGDALLRDHDARGGRVALLRRMTDLVDHGWGPAELVRELSSMSLAGVSSPVAVVLHRARALPTTPPWIEADALVDAREARRRDDLLTAAEAYGRSRLAMNLACDELLEELLAAYGDDPEALAAAKRGAQVSA